MFYTDEVNAVLLGDDADATVKMAMEMNPTNNHLMLDTYSLDAIASNDLLNKASSMGSVQATHLLDLRFRAWVRALGWCKHNNVYFDHGGLFTRLSIVVQHVILLPAVIILLALGLYNTKIWLGL